MLKLRVNCTEIVWFFQRIHQMACASVWCSIISEGWCTHEREKPNRPKQQTLMHTERTFVLNWFWLPQMMKSFGICSGLSFISTRISHFLIELLWYIHRERERQTHNSVLGPTRKTKIMQPKHKLQDYKIWNVFNFVSINRIRSSPQSETNLYMSVQWCISRQFVRIFLFKWVEHLKSFNSNGEFMVSQC